MRNRLVNFVLVVCLAFATLVVVHPARAGLAEGEAAYARRDLRTATRELRPLADQGNARAQFLMGNIARYNEENGRADSSEALGWYRKAASQGLPEAQRELAFLLLNSKPPQISEALTLYNAAAQRGDAEAQYQLGALYDRGLGVRVDLALREAWWQKAAAQGYAPALFALASLAQSGDGVKQNDAEAARLYRQAAQHGSSEAAVELARALRDGRGVARDPAEAWQWFSFAIELANNPRGPAATAMREEREKLAALVPASARAPAEARARQQAAPFKPAPPPPPANMDVAPPPPPPRH